MSDEAECKCPEGIPAWVMTFADLMSLLLAFFVLLFSFSSMDVAIYKELAGSLKDAFGVQREIKAQETPRGINIIAREFSPGRPVPTPINEVRQVTTNESKLHPVFTDPSKDGQENQSKKSDDAEDKSFNAMKEVKGLTDEELELIKQINKDSKLLRESFDSEIDHGLVEVKITQTRIIIMVREKGSFPSGSADIIKPFETMVTKISNVFSDFEGTIIVTGHTDNIPINTYRFRSNWELSSSRAVSVIHALSKDKVLKTKKFEVAAYADTKPIDTNDTYIGRSKNRRVEIMMDYSRKVADKDSATDDEADSAAANGSEVNNSAAINEAATDDSVTSDDVATNDIINDVSNDVTTEDSAATGDVVEAQPNEAPEDASTSTAAIDTEL